MPKAELFNIEDKKRDQEKRAREMSPQQRLYLTLDLMDLARELSPNKSLRSKSDNIEWIELKMKNAE